VGGADHCPLASDLFEPAEKELAESSSVLDLTENRFGDLLAHTVSTAVPCAVELGRHGGNAPPATPLLTAALWFAVTRPAWRDISVDPAAGQVRETCFRTRAGVGGNLFGIGAKHRADRGEQQLEAAPIDRAGLHPLGEDELVRAIRRDLSIVARDDAAFDELDAAVGIGEVALRPIGGPPSDARCGRLVLPIMPEDAPGPSSSGPAAALWLGLA
jgi:hypothetical protein